LASLLREWNFVQMRKVAQNKFKLSVAGALHFAIQRSQTGTSMLSMRHACCTNGPFAVDRGLNRRLQSIRGQGKMRWLKMRT
jgi:hypothetical protein